MSIPNKVKYTRGELIADLVTLVLAVGFAVKSVVLYYNGVSGGEAFIFALVVLIMTGALSIGSVYPQWTNILDKPEKASDKTFHRVRRGCIIAKIAFSLLCDIVLIVTTLI